MSRKRSLVEQLPKLTISRCHLIDMFETLLIRNSNQVVIRGSCPFTRHGCSLESFDDVEYLASNIVQYQIVHVVLVQCKLLLSGCQLLSRQCHNLVYVDISANKLGPELNLISIDILKHNSSLAHLNVSTNNLIGIQFQYGIIEGTLDTVPLLAFLQYLQNNTSLRVLDLRNNYLGGRRCSTAGIESPSVKQVETCGLAIAGAIHALLSTNNSLRAVLIAENGFFDNEIIASALCGQESDDLSRSTGSTDCTTTSTAAASTSISPLPPLWPGCPLQPLNFNPMPSSTCSYLSAPKLDRREITQAQGQGQAVWSSWTTPVKSVSCTPMRQISSSSRAASHAPEKQLVYDLSGRGLRALEARLLAAEVIARDSSVHLVDLSNNLELETIGLDRLVQGLRPHPAASTFHTNARLLRLCLSNCELSSEAGVLLNELLHSLVGSCLLHLDINENISFGDMGVASMLRGAGEGRAASLISLNLSCVGTLCTCMPAIRQFCETEHTLSSLDLEGNNMNCTAVKLFCDYERSKEFQRSSKPTNLCELNLGENCFTVAGSTCLVTWLLQADSGMASTIIKLSLRGNCLCGSRQLNTYNPEVVQSLGAGLRNQNFTLTSLDLHSVDVGARGVRSLFSALTVNSTLCVLLLDNANITQTGALSVGSSLAHVRVLNTLSMDGCVIGPVGGAAIFDGLALNHSLLNVSMARNFLTGLPNALQVMDEFSRECMNALQKCLAKNKHIQALNLGDNRLFGPRGFNVDIHDDEELQICQEMLLTLTTAISSNSSIGGNLQIMDVSNNPILPCIRTACYCTEGRLMNCCHATVGYLINAQHNHHKLRSLLGMQSVCSTATNQDLDHQKIRIPSVHISDQNCRLIGNDITQNNFITHMDLSATHINLAGAKFIAEGICSNYSLRYLLFPNRLQNGEPVMTDEDDLCRGEEADMTVDDFLSMAAEAGSPLAVRTRAARAEVQQHMPKRRRWQGRSAGWREVERAKGESAQRRQLLALCVRHWRLLGPTAINVILSYITGPGAIALKFAKYRTRWL